MGASPQSVFSALLARTINGARKFFVSRGGIILAVILAVFLIVWFAGPLLGLKSVSARVWFLVILAALILSVVLVKWWIDRRKAKQLQRDMEESAFLGTRPDRESEIAMLRMQMQEAIDALKSSELSSSHAGNAAIYALPWYMLIGPAAVGKSSFLRNSNLNFPYSKHDPRGVQGVGGTRNCDWWFSDQAVFLDTAGRYITEEEDREEWFAFLELLRKSRSKQPINGAIVAVNLAEILTSDNATVLENAKIVRDRIDELVSQLGIVFPVYLIFTKTDLLKGFSSYFDDLSDKERDQVWGASTHMLDVKNTDSREVGEIFAEEFDALHARLCAHRMIKLSMQRESARKVEIMDMPNQFQAAGPRLVEFVAQVFKKSPYKENPIFGGFFFTSAAQHGTPIQYLPGSELHAFGAVPNAALQESEAGHKQYFIHNLLREVILPNSSQVSRNKRMTRRDRLIKQFSIGLAVIIAIVGVWMLNNSYNTQLDLIAEIKDSSKDLTKNVTASRADLGKAFKSVDSYYNLTHALWADEGGLSMMTPGELQEPLGQNFLKAMQSAFLYPVADQLEEHLGDYANHVTPRDEGGDPASQRSRRTAAAYEELKLYLYLTSPEVVEHTALIEPFTNIWLATLKKNEINVGAKDKEQLAQMLTYYLKHMRDPANSPLLARAWSADQNLIANVRAELSRQPHSERLYAEMRDVGSRKLEPVKLQSLLNEMEPGALISTTTIPGIYTREGWEKFVWPYLKNTVDESMKSDWVMGGVAASNEKTTDEMRAQLVAQVRQIYFADYTSHWLKMLSGISARRYESLSDADAQLQSYTSDSSAMYELIKSINWNVAVPDPEKNSLLAKATDRNGAVSADGKPVVEELRGSFKDLIRITHEAISDDENNWFSTYMKSLGSIRKEISKLASSSDVPRDARIFAVKLMNGDVESELNKGWLAANQGLADVDAATSEAVSNLVRAPIVNVWATIVGQAQKDLDRSWKDKVFFAYNKGLRGHYPFVSDGSDAPLGEVADFFKPAGGIFWGFVDDMGTFLERKGNTWEARKWMGVSLDFNPEFMQAIRKSSDISDGMFAQGSANPSVNFAAYPYPGPALSESALTIDGADYRYRNGPQEWQNFVWPGPNPGGRVRAVRIGSLASGELVANGPWALMRLLDKAHIAKEGGGSFMATWSLPDSSGQRLNVKFRIRQDRASTLLTGALQDYQLPPEIFKRQSAGK